VAVTQFHTVEALHGNAGGLGVDVFTEGDALGLVSWEEEKIITGILTRDSSVEASLTRTNDLSSPNDFSSIVTGSSGM
jgi:hypothetical protein